LPPLRFGPIQTASPALNFVLPATNTLAQLDGGVTANGAPLAGARITAVEAGTAVSAPALSQPDGGYALYLAPNASSPLLQIGPPADADAGVAPAAEPLDPFPMYYPIPFGPSVDLDLPPVATLSGRVLDLAGSGVPSARVYARSAGAAWTLARSVVADATGSYSLTLRAGTYQVQAAPPADPTAPALSAEQTVTVPAPGALNLSCPIKVRRYGQVLGPDGLPVRANFAVVATRLADTLVTTRAAFTTATDANGVYHVVADTGRWRFEVVPPPDATLPRSIVQFDLPEASDPGESALPPIRISRPLVAVGTVKGLKAGSPDAPVPGAQVSFFAVDALGHSVFLGSGLTDAQGRYQAIVPDVAQTTAVLEPVPVPR
jgi:hypothetical protein